METILIADCRDREGHGDGYPSRKRRSMTLPTTAGTTMAGISLILITTLFVVRTVKLAMKPIGIRISSRTAPPPPVLVLTPSWAGGPYPTSEVQNKMIIMGHQISSSHVPVVRSFFIL